MKKESMDDVLRDVLRADKIPSDALNAAILSKAEERQADKKKRQIPRTLVAAASVVLIITILGAGLFHGQVQAMMERLFGTITETYVEDDTWKKEQAEEEVYHVNEQISRQGIGISLEEVLLDANKLAYCIKIRSDEQWGAKLKHSGVNCHVYIDGELLTESPVAVGWTADEHTETWVEEVSLNPGMKLSGNVEVAVCVDQVKTVPKVHDHWNFKTIVNVNAANRHTMRDLTTTEMKLKNGDILILHQVIATSTDCRLYFTYKPQKKIKKYEIHLDGADNLGNRITDSGYNMQKIKGKNAYRVVMMIDGALRHDVNKLVLAPYQLDRGNYDYRQMGETFSIVLR